MMRRLMYGGFMERPTPPIHAAVLAAMSLHAAVGVKQQGIGRQAGRYADTNAAWTRFLAYLTHPASPTS